MFARNETQLKTMSLNNVFIHPTAIVESDTVGEGTRIWGFSHVLKGAVIGKNCNVGDHCFIESGATIGDGVVIKNANMIWSGLQVEDSVFIGPNVIFTNDRYPRSRHLPAARNRYEDDSWLETTTIKRGATLGAASIILPGITIGEYALISAGALITKDVKPYAIKIGNPARQKAWACKCGHPLLFRMNFSECDHCNLKYEQRGNSITPT
jgi:acetyltransferase-like isoleucine patch superfamily enzyme